LGRGKLIAITFARGSASGAPARRLLSGRVAAGRATVLVKFLTHKNLLDWQGLVLAAPRAPAQRLPPQRQKGFLGHRPKSPRPLGANLIKLFGSGIGNLFPLMPPL